MGDQWKAQKACLKRPHQNTNIRSYDKYNFTFLCVAPSLWNKLPDHVCNMHCLQTFQGHVKAHLFTQSYY